MQSGSTVIHFADQLRDGESRGFDHAGVGRDTLIVVRSDGEIHAYVDDCPHVPGSSLAWKKNAYLSADRRHIVCHAHGARFDIKTGLCSIGPCMGQALTRVPITTLTNGEIQLAKNN
ncbi:MAG: hypothetical protein CFE43_17950 [Burkholderiales bacterium PBB3]|nr:MAG: hypothetical protein CFE43_17950 [Burkholderiales bacterium PBB3]